MATKPAEVKEEVKNLTDDGREATVVDAPATSFDERTASKTIAEQVAEPEA